MTKYPLSWPAGWKRTKERIRARFQKHRTEYRKSWSDPNKTERYYIRGAVSIAEGTKRVTESLSRMGVLQHDIIISTNLDLRNDGLPRSGQKEPTDPGVAVYWLKWKEKQHKVMAVDQYDRVADNLAAIAATLEAMRAIERHGGAAILDRAFTGFECLPAPNTWRSVLGFTEDAGPTIEQVKRQYRMLSMGSHPDVEGGSEPKQKELNWAMAEAEKELVA